MANSGGRGSIEDSALEASNVDISTEFADLIVAQRAFEANSKAVTTLIPWPRRRSTSSTRAAFAACGQTVTAGDATSPAPLLCGGVSHEFFLISPVSGY